MICCLVEMTKVSWHPRPYSAMKMEEDPRYENLISHIEVCSSMAKRFCATYVLTRDVFTVRADLQFRGQEQAIYTLQV